MVIGKHILRESLNIKSIYITPLLLHPLNMPITTSSPTVIVYSRWAARHFFLQRENAQRLTPEVGDFCFKKKMPIKKLLNFLEDAFSLYLFDFLAEALKPS